MLSPVACADADSAPPDDSIVGSYQLVADGESGAPPGRIDVVRGEDGALRAWVHRKYRYWELFDVEVRPGSVSLSFETQATSYHLEVARQASGALGGEITGTQVVEADDYVDESELFGTVGPDTTAPALTTLGLEHLEDAVDLLPWNPIAVELSEPITVAEAASFAAPGLAVAPRVREGWVDGFIVKLDDWEQGWSGALEASLADPSGNSAPAGFEVELASVGPAFEAMDFEGTAPPLAWGAVEFASTAACESGACALLSAKVSPSGCYAPAGFAFALPAGATRVLLRHRVYASTPTTEGSPSAPMPILLDTPRAEAAGAEPYGPVSVLLDEAGPGAPEPWAGQWTDVELTLAEPADTRTAVRAELGGCGGIDALSPSALVAVEWIVVE